MDLPVKYSGLSPKKKKQVREKYVELQGGKCCHCGQPLDKNPCSSVRCRKVDKTLFPPGFFRWPIHLHHSHETGLTIGAVHCYCNAVLWQYYGE